jgi:hypothetical protein
VKRILTIPLLALLLAPATARAEAPPDAVAFADAAVQFEADVRPLAARLDRAFDPNPRCARRIVRRAPARARDDVGLLITVHALRNVGRILAPALQVYSMRLHAVDTADPALRSGRTAWRRIRRQFAVRLQAFEPMCPALRRFARSGYRPTPALRRALRLVVEFGSFDRSLAGRLRIARERLEALGIPHDRAVVFESPDIASANGVRRDALDVAPIQAPASSPAAPAASWHASA